MCPGLTGPHHAPKVRPVRLVCALRCAYRRIPLRDVRCTVVIRQKSKKVKPKRHVLTKNPLPCTFMHYEWSRVDLSPSCTSSSRNSEGGCSLSNVCLDVDRCDVSSCQLQRSPRPALDLSASLGCCSIAVPRRSKRSWKPMLLRSSDPKLTTPIWWPRTLPFPVTSSTWQYTCASTSAVSALVQSSNNNQLQREQALLCGLVVSICGLRM